MAQPVLTLTGGYGLTFLVSPRVISVLCAIDPAYLDLLELSDVVGNHFSKKRSQNDSFSQEQVPTSKPKCLGATTAATGGFPMLFYPHLTYPPKVLKH